MIYVIISQKKMGKAEFKSYEHEQKEGPLEYRDPGKGCCMAYVFSSNLAAQAAACARTGLRN